MKNYYSFSFLFLAVLFFGPPPVFAQSVDEINDMCRKKLTEGDLFGVIILLNDAIEKRPNEGSFYNNRGIANFHLENHLQALADFEKAESLDVKNSFLPYLKGSLFFALNRFDEAITAYTSYLSTEEGKNSEADYFSWFELAASYANSTPRQFEKSIIYSRKVLSVENCEASAHWNIYYAHRSLGRMEPAIASLKKAIACMPTNDLYLSTLADEYTKKGDYEAARDYYQAAIDQNDNMGQYYSNLAYCYEHAGETGRACELYQEAQRRNFRERDCHIKKLCGIGACNN